MALRSHYGFDSLLLPARRARAATRRAGWRARSAGSAAATSSRSRMWRSLAELNDALRRGRPRRRRPAHRRAAGSPSAQDFAAEQTPSAAAAGRAVRCRTASLTAAVDAKARICVRQCCLLGAGPSRRPAGRGPPRRRPPSRSSTAPGRRRARPVAAQGRRGCWCWTTTWRSWPASPARCPGATALAPARPRRRVQPGP